MPTIEKVPARPLERPAGVAQEGALPMHGNRNGRDVALVDVERDMTFLVVKADAAFSILDQLKAA